MFKIILFFQDTCPFGDKSDAFIFNEVLTTCKDLKRQPASCYSASLKKWCCDTCEEIKNEKSEKNLHPFQII